ncbi:spore coat protein U domain-containing protein [Ramlibacter sp.]|uniref:spore coat protein U domain-containing protein n=1 Tax=Ramlibacter sp. TaxID=1917967 RepID=UPI002D4F1D21|nr:spore coat protein U domain-containing protein [Ramlibacter sp.]HYD75651.1 spore coat protein U domain-containing protein [Ramlibacter sp.]
MSSRTLSRWIAAAALSSCSLLSWASDTATMTVTATVVGVCKLVSVPTLDFGTLNQATAPVVNPPAVNVTYRCTKGTPPGSFKVGTLTSGPFNGVLSNGTDTITYTINWTPPTTAGSGLGSGVTPIDVPLIGSMPGGANYQNVSAGTYTQSVPIEISP